jgi:hypothetical protein
MMANVMGAVALGRDPRAVVSAEPTLFARIVGRVNKARETAERLEAYREHVEAMRDATPRCPWAHFDADTSRRVTKRMRLVVAVLERGGATVADVDREIGGGYRVCGPVLRALKRRGLVTLNAVDGVWSLVPRSPK